MNPKPLFQKMILLAASFPLTSLVSGCMDGAATTPEVEKQDVTHGAMYPLADTADLDDVGRIRTPLPARMPDGRVLCRYQPVENEFGGTIYRPVTFHFGVLERMLADDSELATLANLRSVRTCEDADRVSAMRERQLIQSLEGESADTPAAEEASDHDKILNGVTVSGAGPNHDKKGIVALRRAFADVPSHPAHTFCSGTYISARHILTAAHCFGSSGATSFYTYTADRGAVFHNSAQVTVHPDYSAGAWSTDIAVIQLVAADVWATTARRFRLYTNGTTIGKGLKIYGYGVTDQAGGGLGPLHTGNSYASIRIDSHSSGYFKAIGHTARACQGDSGGPAIDEDSGSMAIWGVYIRGSHDPRCTSSGGDMIWTKTSTSMDRLIRPATGHPCPVTNNVAQCW